MWSRIGTRCSLPRKMAATHCTATYFPWTIGNGCWRVPYCLEMEWFKPTKLLSLKPSRWLAAAKKSHELIRAARCQQLCRSCIWSTHESRQFWCTRLCQFLPEWRISPFKAEEINPNRPVGIHTPGCKANVWRRLRTSGDLSQCPLFLPSLAQRFLLRPGSYRSACTDPPHTSTLICSRVRRLLRILLILSTS